MYLYNLHIHIILKIDFMLVTKYMLLFQMVSIIYGGWTTQQLTRHMSGHTDLLFPQPECIFSQS